MKEKFKSHFNNLPSDGFLKPIGLTDTAIGFSVYKQRPKGFKSLFGVYIKNEDLENSEILKPLVLTASYGKETKNGIVVSSSEFQKGINWPIDLISNDEFFYNIETDKLFYKKQEITGLEILQKVDKLHIKPTKLIKGFPLRVKLAFWRKWVAVIPNIFIWLLYVVSGDKITKNLWVRKIKQDQIKPEIYKEIEQKESQKLDVFGYKASKWAVTFYCLLHLVFFEIVKKWDIQSDIISSIFSNNFLTVIYVIPSLGFVDYLLPKIFRYLIDKTTNFVVWASFKKIKV